jgi:hypothetical protein
MKRGNGQVNSEEPIRTSVVLGVAWASNFGKLSMIRGSGWKTALSLFMKLQWDFITESFPFTLFPMETEDFLAQWPTF